MNIDNIIKLIDAGYSKEEIKAMSEDPDKKEPDKKEPDKKEPDKKEPDKKEPEKQEPDKKDPEENDLLKLMVSKFDELKTAIQENNIKQSNNKTLDAPAPEELLANIIKPANK